MRGVNVWLRKVEWVMATWGRQRVDRDVQFWSQKILRGERVRRVRWNLLEFTCRLVCTRLQIVRQRPLYSFRAFRPLQRVRIRAFRRRRITQHRS